MSRIDSPKAPSWSVRFLYIAEQTISEVAQALIIEKARLYGVVEDFQREMADEI